MTKKRLVFDTNALISAAIMPRSTPRRALEKGIQVGILLTSHVCFAELEEVIYRKKFRHRSARHRRRTKSVRSFERLRQFSSGNPGEVLVVQRWGKGTIAA